MKKQRSYSGRFLLRLPKSVHESIAVAAKEEGISMNEFVTLAVVEIVVRRMLNPASMKVYKGKKHGVHQKRKS